MSRDSTDQNGVHFVNVHNTPVNTNGWTVPTSGRGNPPIVIGWWPRYASAFQQGPLSAQHLRSPTYAWLGLPVAASGAYFDPMRMSRFFSGIPLAEVAVDDLDGYFHIEARAASAPPWWTGPAPGASQGSMDWSLQLPVDLPTSGGARDNVTSAFDSDHDRAHAFHSIDAGVAVATPVDGAELRIIWRYSDAPAVQGNGQMAAAFQALGEACGSSPSISSAALRYLAPVRVLATSNSQ